MAAWLLQSSVARKRDKPAIGSAALNSASGKFL
jgi:hypothetical protein